MKNGLLNRVAISWTILIALTFLSAEVLRTPGHRGGHLIGVSAVLFVTLGKARIIGSEFMELRGARLILRLAFDAWLAVVGSAIFILQITPFGN